MMHIHMLQFEFHLHLHLFPLSFLLSSIMCSVRSLWQQLPSASCSAIYTVWTKKRLAFKIVLALCFSFLCTSPCSAWLRFPFGEKTNNSSLRSVAAGFTPQAREYFKISTTFKIVWSPWARLMLGYCLAHCHACGVLVAGTCCQRYYSTCFHTASCHHWFSLRFPTSWWTSIQCRANKPTSLSRWRAAI